MRVEGQGKAVDFYPAQNEVKRAVVQEGNGEGSTRSEEPEAGPKVDLQRIKAAVDVVNNAMNISNYHLEFQLHSESDRYQVKVVDTNTGEVIRKIPPDYMLELSARVKQMLDEALGFIIDKLV